MDLRELRETLRKNFTENTLHKQKKVKENKNKEPKIIGITGSKGKSTTAYIVHEYLKKIGKKSILYSSIKIDSPLSNYKKEESVENPIYNKEMLLNLINEAIEYEADYIVLEINERAIKNKIIEEVKFDCKVITNIIPKHNEYFYNPEEYVEIKRSFLEKSEESTCVFGITTGIEKEDYNEMKKRCKGKIHTYGSEYVIFKRGLEKEEFDTILEPGIGALSQLKGINFTVNRKGKKCHIESKLMLEHNAMNILCAISTIEAIKEFQEKEFEKFIKELTIEGREEKIEYQGRIILISPHLMPQLEELEKIKEGKLIVITGTSGIGYKGWHKDFTIESYKKEKKNNLKKAYEYIKKYADHVIITENETAGEEKEKLLEKQRKMLDENTSYEVVKSRKEAIKKAIEKSQKQDIILISGRGNRRTFCNHKDHFTHFKDKEELEKILKEVKK